MGKSNQPSVRRRCQGRGPFAVLQAIFPSEGPNNRELFALERAGFETVSSNLFASERDFEAIRNCGVLTVTRFEQVQEHNRQSLA